MVANLRVHEAALQISENASGAALLIQSAGLQYPATPRLLIYEAELTINPDVAEFEFSIWSGGVEIPATATVWVGGVEYPLTGLADTTPTPPGVMFGANVNNGYPNDPVATRIAKLGRVPLCRGPYYSALPAAYNDTKLRDGRAPEKRAIVSYSTVASDAALAAYSASVPADWWIGVCYYSEPNDNINAGDITAAAWKANLLHMSQVLAAQPNAARCVPVAIMSAPKSYADGVAWNDSWMPTFAEMNNPNAIFSWDNYSNPHGGTALATPYDAVNTVADRAYNLLQTKGWLFEAGHWGVTEFNAPRRTFDTDETQRRVWLKSYIDYALARPVPPKFLCLWEGNGSQWDQNIYTQPTWDLLKPYWLNSK